MAKLKEKQIDLILEGLKVYKGVLENTTDFGSFVARHIAEEEGEDIEDQIKRVESSCQEKIEDIILIEAQLIEIKREKRAQERKEFVEDVKDWVSDLGTGQEKGD